MPYPFFRTLSLIPVSDAVNAGTFAVYIQMKGFYVCPGGGGRPVRGGRHKKCRAVRPGRCAMANGGCWKDTRHGKTSVCLDSDGILLVLFSMWNIFV
jgi:hypothetical protein